MIDATVTVIVGLLASASGALTTKTVIQAQFGVS
jgi:hypothetical protein